MAEKEERIFIGFINPEGDACPVPYGKCNSLCDNCKGGMTRQEAIERIAKALIDIALTGHYSRFEDSCVVEDAIPYAKAALNALLSK